MMPQCLREWREIRGHSLLRQVLDPDDQSRKRGTTANTRHDRDQHMFLLRERSIIEGMADTKCRYTPSQEAMQRPLCRRGAPKVEQRGHRCEPMADDPRKVD